MEYLTNMELNKANLSGRWKVWELIDFWTGVWVVPGHKTRPAYGRKDMWTESIKDLGKSFRGNTKDLNKVSNELLNN